MIRLYEERLPFWTPPLHIQGLKGAGAAFIALAMYKKDPQPTIWVFPEPELAQKFYHDLCQLGAPVEFFPAPAVEKPDPALDMQRMQALLSMRQHTIWVTWAGGYAAYVPAKENLHTLHLKQGHTYEWESLLQTLESWHFSAVDSVAAWGEYAVRGGILDVFSFGAPPLRLRFMGNTLQLIQVFDIETQLSQRTLSEVTLSAEIKPQVGEILYGHFQGRTLLYDSQWVLSQIQKLHQQEPTRYAPPEAFLPFWEKSFELGSMAYKPMPSFSWNQKAQPHFEQNYELLEKHLSELPVTHLHLCAENEKQLARLRVIVGPWEKSLGYSVLYHPISLHEGFVDEVLQQAYYTDHEIFHRFFSPVGIRRFRRSQALTLEQLYQLQPGDYVVHVRHGIGRYAGLVPLPTDPPTEAMKLIYQNDAFLYVPISQLDKVSPYRAPTDAPPKLSRLGSAEWQNRIQKVRQGLRELAFDLVQVYAQRQMAKGYAYPPDTLLQAQMEALFPYQETPDQLSAIEEIKKDLQSPRPMDCLLCGDVGFGKTEVALRAAFKVVQEGKQVAILVPTTVLAMQHYQTFVERLRGFRVQVQHLSRLCSSAQQKKILKDLAQGKIDILIGTHRLLSDDVQFHDLGLLVIDEEHKFGVAAKEKLRVKYPSVDVLSMSATPIPRTLQMALSQIRSICLITTPPENRLPVETHIVPFSFSAQLTSQNPNQEKILRALQRELDRRGQVFVVHNRIKDIPDIVEALKKLLPTAKVAYAHAQMPPTAVEKILVEFIQHQHDILVSTNIVESGLDIPNVNTILIHQAHLFGLSDLHQLRGRVGRSGRQAYCYLLVPSLELLPLDTLRRLQAIEEFSDLGSGFQIALRDLEMRGAGEIFGPQQSGYIAEVGYELYQKMLQEAIHELSEGATHLPTDKPECIVDLQLDIRIPETYISHVGTRLEFYRRLSQASAPERPAICKELEDRFGDLPPSVRNLLHALNLRDLGEKIGLHAIRQVRKEAFRLTISDPTPAFSDSPFWKNLLAYLQKNPKEIRLQQEKNALYIHWQNLSVSELIDKLVSLCAASK
ncbi:MAG: transcription-repair coupling factor [Bacteroidia bacterium]